MHPGFAALDALPALSAGGTDSGAGFPAVAPRSGPSAAKSVFYSVAVTEKTGGSRVAAVNQVWPASPDPNTSPDVAPK